MHQPIREDALKLKPDHDGAREFLHYQSSTIAPDITPTQLDSDPAPVLAKPVTKDKSQEVKQPGLLANFMSRYRPQQAY